MYIFICSHLQELILSYHINEFYILIEESHLEAGRKMCLIAALNLIYQRPLDSITCTGTCTGRINFNNEYAISSNPQVTSSHHGCVESILQVCYNSLKKWLCFCIKCPQIITRTLVYMYIYYRVPSFIWDLDHRFI